MMQTAEGDKMKYLFLNIKRYFKLSNQTRNVSYPVMLLGFFLSSRVSDDYFVSVWCMLIAIAVIVIYHTIKLPEEFKGLWDKLFYVGFTFFLFYFLIVYLVGKAFDYFLLKSVY